MEFIGETAEIQQRLAATPEMAERRRAVVETLKPRRGERIIEVGCGAGLLLRDIGLEVGPHGLAAGVDISPDQIAAAARECAGVPAVKPELADIRALAYPDGVFDAAVSVQVVEYIDDLTVSLEELRRILKPGGRVLILATNWDSAFWHGAERRLTAEMVAAWESHAAHPNLPAILPSRLQAAGFGALHQLPVPVVNPDFRDTGFAHWIARLMAAHARAEGVDEPRTREWIDQLTRADAADEFFFSSVPILTTAEAA